MNVPRNGAWDSALGAGDVNGAVGSEYTIPSPDWLIMVSLWLRAAAAASARLVATRARCPELTRWAKTIVLFLLFLPPSSCAVAMWVFLFWNDPHNEQMRDMPSACNIINELARAHSKSQLIMSSAMKSGTPARTTCLAAPYPPPTGTCTRRAIECNAPKAVPAWCVCCMIGVAGNTTAGTVRQATSLAAPMMLQ